MEQAPAGLDWVDTTVNVRYAETDQMGVVYYANYLVWFEVGRVAWCRAKGFHYRDMERKDGRLLVVAEVNCRYRAPARFDDDVLIRTAIARATDKVIRFRYEILNQRTRQLLANGESVHVVTDQDVRPARLPEKYYSLFGLHPSR
jgi:acyl-CoA thioester hydrolase